MRKAAVPVLAFLLVFGLTLWGADDTIVEEIVARVNDQIITRSEYLREKDKAAEDAQHLQSGEEATKPEDVLRSLIDRQLLLEKGKEDGINADADVIKRLDDMRKQMHLDSMEDLEKAAQQQGISFEDFKQGIREQIVTQQVIRDEVGRNIQITQQQIADYYKQHQKDFDQPEQIRLSEILISTQSPAAPGASAGSGESTPDPAELAAAQAKAEDALKKIRAGAKFEDVATAVSNGPTAENGGDLGYFKRGALAKELEDKTFSMKAGEVTDPIRTKQGFVILKVTEHDQAGIPPLQDVENQIQGALYYQQLQPSLRAYFTKLREEAYIDIKPGYVDTGASPNETKPEYTDSTTPTKGKKQKKSKA